MSVLGGSAIVNGQLLTAAADIGAPAFADDFTAGLGKWNVRTDYQKNHYGFNTPANCTVQADGLHITAKRQTGLAGQPTTKPYTTGYVDTIGRFSQSFGRWEIEARLPRARGLWPAFWLRCDTTLAEIDILEAVGPLIGTAVETVHESTNGDLDKSGFEYKPPGLDLTQWHKFALDRARNGVLRWYVNGVQTRQRTLTDLDNQGHPMSWLAGPTFASPLNLRINLQVGGTMPAWYGVDVDDTSALPDDLVIRSVVAYAA